MFVCVVSSLNRNLSQICTHFLFLMLLLSALLPLWGFCHPESSEGMFMKSSLFIFGKETCAPTSWRTLLTGFAEQP